MPCKLCRFAYACMAMRKDDMNQEEIKEFNKKVSSLKGTNPAQTLSELEAESESRTDRLLDELADNMAKADEAMKPDKPLEQSEFNHVVLDQIVRQQEELDRQADEIKRLKDFIKIEIDHAKAFKVLESEPEKSNTQMFINRAEEALERK